LGASPLDAFALILSGAFGSSTKLAYVMTAWVPVLFCSAGLLVTFAAGLWNIGIEGQIIMGALFATGLMQALQDSLQPAIVLILAALAGLMGGACWGMLVGVLRLYGNVNEIFGGLGLNFIAGSLTVYLVLGPWKRPGIGSTSGTQPFPLTWLPAFKGFRTKLKFIELTTMGFRVGRYEDSLGLQLKASGKICAAKEFLFNICSAFGLCGALFLGWVLVVAVPAIISFHSSRGYGFLAFSSFSWQTSVLCGVYPFLSSLRRFRWVVSNSLFSASSTLPWEE
jgi:simple sugar transport system permease protein